MPKFALVSDMHENLVDIKDVDYAILTGDFSFQPNGDIKGELKLWKEKLSPYFRNLRKNNIKLIGTPGNHDALADDRSLIHIIKDDFDVFEKEGFVELDGFNFLFFCFCRLEDWACFATDEAQAQKVDWILRNKNNVDFLITHSPPFSFMSKSDWGSFHVERLLCEVRPKHLHAFGHVHETRGIGRVDELTLLNCAYVDKDYRPIGYYYVYDTETKTLTTRKG